MIHVSRWTWFVWIWEIVMYRKLPFISAFPLLSSSSSSSFIFHHLKSSLIYNQQPQHRSIVSSSSSSFARRRNIQLPLVDFSSFYNTMNSTTHTQKLTTDSTKSLIIPPIIPLPCSHLPTELYTILYTEVLNIQVPLHKMLLEQIWSEYAMNNQKLPLYGHIVSRGMNHFTSNNNNNTKITTKSFKKKIQKEYSDFDDMDTTTSSSISSLLDTTKDTWIGSIGVATEILQIIQPNNNNNNNNEEESSLMNKFQENKNNYNVESSTVSSLSVITRGSFRFIVKEIIQTFPFIVAMVDEYIDEKEEEKEPVKKVVTTTNMSTSETSFMIQQEQPSLISQTLYALQVLVHQILEAKPKILSPLEKNILQDLGGIPTDMISDEALTMYQKNQAEELVALHQVFCSSLLDIAPTQLERYYTVAIMAAEMAQLDDPFLRREWIVSQQGRVRLEKVLQELLNKITLYKERIEKGIEIDYFYPWKDSSSVTRSTSSSSSSSSSNPSLSKPGISTESSKNSRDNQNNMDYDQDLLVGEPTLPSWAKQIKVGTVIEYYWNDEYGWCRGRVTDKPIQILDELIVTVRFDDGEIHRLPFRGDEKARWRPVR